jgi:hypothetical protein
VRLETQLTRLAEIGLALAPGLTVDDVLTFDSREVFEQDPFGLLLLVMGLESQGKSWGRRMCDRAWTLDIKCVDGVGDEYVYVAGQLARLAGQPDALADLAERTDPGTGVHELTYRVGEQVTTWRIEDNWRWIDLMVVSYLAEDLEGATGRFYCQRDQGQYLPLYFLTEDAAGRLIELVGPGRIELLLVE